MLSSEQAEKLFGSQTEIFACSFGVHGFFQCTYRRENTEISVNSGGIAGTGILSDGSRPERLFWRRIFAELSDTGGPLPMAVCRSRRPSPVITKSASLRLPSRSTAFRIRSIPDFNSPFKKVTKAKPSPPAAPGSFHFHRMFAGKGFGSMAVVLHT